MMTKRSCYFVGDINALTFFLDVTAYSAAFSVAGAS